MNYANPSGRAEWIALARAKATATTGPVRSIVFNPGGPGGSGIELLPTLAEKVPAAVRQHFDIVTFDPRGVGASRPLLTCASPPDVTTGLGQQTDWLAYFTAKVKAQQAAYQQCVAKNSPFINYAGTNNVARDLDRLRQALGEAYLTYWGVSYGTRLGADYEQMFPGKVGRFILDGDVSPRTTFADFLLQRSWTYDDALRFYFGQEPKGASAFKAIEAKLLKGPVVLPDGKELTLQDFYLSIFGHLKDEASFPNETQRLIKLAKEIGVNPSQPAPPLNGPTPPAPVEENVDNINSTTPDPANEHDSSAVQLVVNCIDLPHPDSVSTLAADAAMAQPLGPRFANFMLLNLADCNGLNVTPDPVPVIHPGAPSTTTLVVGSQHDPATPLYWSQQMTLALPGSRLVTYGGSEHGVTWFRGSSCVDNVADTYMLTKTLPASDVTCPALPPGP